MTILGHNQVKSRNLKNNIILLLSGPRAILTIHANKRLNVFEVLSSQQKLMQTIGNSFNYFQNSKPLTMIVVGYGIGTPSTIKSMPYNYTIYFGNVIILNIAGTYIKSTPNYPHVVRILDHMDAYLEYPKLSPYGQECLTTWTHA
jgi:hypothetical protein